MLVSPNLHALRQSLIELTKRGIFPGIRSAIEEVNLLPNGNFLFVKIDEFDPQRSAILRSEIQCQIGDGILNFEYVFLIYNRI